MNRLLIVSAVLAVFSAEAKVRLAAPFTDGMVLQREMPVRVWGTADAGEKVQVIFADAAVNTVADSAGKWMVELPPMEDIEEEAEFTIRKKSFPVRPMSPEEAILQMNLVDHNFFIFEDESTGDICVVYKRKDGNYGLIEPE
jgi:hypothetical protein